MKRFLIISLAATMLLSALVFSASAKSFKFTDISETDWCYDDVKTAVETGIINGKTETEFKPEDNLTYAEAIKLAACMNQLYAKGSVTLKNGEPWYLPYVDYCKENGIIGKEYEYNSPATRAGYMQIFANALPDDNLKAINEVPEDSIPDVPYSEDYAESVYKLYRAGILQGVDDKHNCTPLANIKRNEVATIISRMTDSSKRICFSLDAETAEEKPEKTLPLAIRIQPSKTIKTNGTDKVRLSVVAANGKEPYTYQWQSAAVDESESFKDLCDNDTITGAQTDELSFVPENVSKTEYYRCVITDADGTSKITTSCEVTIEHSPLSASVKKHEKTIDAKGQVQISIEVGVTGGKAPYTYKWQKSPSPFSPQPKEPEWKDVENITQPKISISKSLSSQQEVYRCIVTDANGNTAETPSFVVDARQ